MTWKCDFFETWNSRLKRTYICMSSFTTFWLPDYAFSAESWSTWWNFWQVIKPTVHAYMASSSTFSAFWKPDSFYFWRVIKPTIQWNVLTCTHFMHFGGLKMLFLPSVKVVWSLCRHFGDFRIRFLLSRNTKGLRVPSFLWPHSLHFVGLKMQILLGRDKYSLLWAFGRPEIPIDTDSWKPRFKGT